jgi:hypothetical protein
MALRYKFVELSTVTDETLETAVNEWVEQGWQLDAIRFVVTEHSRRPAMAFVSFTRDGSEERGETGGPGGPGGPPGPSGTAHVIAAPDNDVE